MAGTIKLDGTTFLSKSGSDFTVDVGTDGSYANGSINSNVTFPAGHIIQSVTSVTSDTDSTTSSTYQDSSTSQAITTVATNSKLLITVYSGMVLPQSNYLITTIKRAITDGATTTDLTGGYSDGMMRATESAWNPRYYEWIDAPSQSADTTITYTAMFRNHDNSETIYFSHENTFVRVSVYEITV